MACSVHRPKVISEFQKTFGSVINSKPLIAKANKILKRKLRDLNKSLKNSNDPKEQAGLRKDIKNIEKEIFKSSRELKDSPMKFKVLTQVRDLLVDQVDDIMTSAHGQLDIPIMMDALNTLLNKRFGAFNHLSDLSAEDLTAIKFDLVDIFQRQAISSGTKKGSLKGRIFGRYKPGMLSWWQDQVMDPVMAMLEVDRTGFGVKFVQATKDFLSKTSSDGNYYKDRMKGHLGKLSQWVLYNNYVYNVDDKSPIEGEGRVVTQSDEVRRASTIDNLISLAHQILDGHTRRIVPISPFTTINGKPAKTEEFKEDEKEVLTILKQAHDNHMYEGGNVQKYVNPQTKEEFMYIPIRKEIDGKVIWRAYEVPMQTFQQEGGDTFTGIALPPNDKDRIDLWLNWFLGSKNEDGTPKTNRRLASTVNNIGGTVQGAMNEAWYSSQTWEPLVGYKMKKGQRIDIKTQAYGEYILNEVVEDLDALPDQFYSFVDSMRKELKSLFLEEINSASKGNKDLNAILTSTGLKGKYTKKEIDAIVNEVMGLDVNNNTWVKDGQVVSAFKIMGERNDYSTWMFSLPDTLRAFGRNITISEANLKSAQAKYRAIVAEKGKAVPEALIALKAIRDSEKALEIAVDKRDIALALKEKHEAQPMNLQDVIKYSKQRSGLLSPFKETNRDGVEVHAGRRLDFNVFLEYAENITKQMNQNHLKLSLLKSSLAVDKPVRDYLIDQTKATFGRHDATAGFMGLNYGTQHIANKVQSAIRMIPFFGKNYIFTADMLYKPLHRLSSFISGNTLQMGSALNNNFQRLNTYAEVMSELEVDMEDLKEMDRTLSERVAKASGVTDVMIAIGDALIGSANQKMTAMTGVITVKDLALLKLSKPNFMSRARKSARWKSWMAKATEGLDLDAQAAGFKYDDVLDGVWELTHGIVDKKNQNKNFTAKERKALKLKLEGVMTDSMINKFTTWGLGGGFLYSILKKAGADPILSFTGAEVKMREEAALIGAYLAWQNGLIPLDEIDDNKSPLEHPIALNAAREMVYATMFGMSQQFLSKMFRGAIGQTLWKFKPYQWHQMRTEYKYWDTYKKSIKHLGRAERLMRYANLLNPNYVPKYRAEMRYKRFLTTRALWSVAGSVKYTMIPMLNVVYSTAYNVIRGLTGQGLGPAIRGGSSVFWSAMFQTMFMMGAVVDFYDDEDEEKIFQDTYRLFLPMFVNMFIEMMKSKDPVDAILLPVKLVLKPVALIAEQVKKAVAAD